LNSPETDNLVPIVLLILFCHVQPFLRHREKDSVGETEENPDLTGGMFVYLSPGVRFTISHATSVYAYVQVPVVQNVNGTQLTSRVNYLVGVQERF